MSEEEQPVPEVQQTLNRFDDASRDYYEYADYESVRDADRCRKFIVACRRLIQLTPQASEHGGANERATFDVRLLNEERRDAQKWLAVNGRKVAAKARNQSPIFRRLDTSGMFD